MKNKENNSPPIESLKHPQGQSGIVFCNVSQNNNINNTSNHDETPSLMET